MNTLTIDEVKAIHAANVARKDAPEGWVPRQATRTHVKQALLERNPMPCTSLTPEMQAARDRREPLTYKEHEEQLSHQRSQVTELQHAAYASARAARHPHTVDADGKVTVKDAIHHVQKLHGIEMWVEADRLVGEAVPS